MTTFSKLVKRGSFALCLVLATLLFATKPTAAPGALGYVPFAVSGGSYTQNFDSLPFTNGTAVNTASPVTIGGAGGNPTTATAFTVPGTANSSFSLSDPTLGAGNTAIASGMDGWYGFAPVANKLGAHEGSQTTGGLISFGGLANSNRAVGLAGTSTTGATAFAVCFKNTSGATLNQITLSFTGELWRQQTAAKTLDFAYFVDTTNATPVFPTSGTTAVAGLQTSFATGALAAVDGTQAANQQARSATNLNIGAWGNNQYLWLVWTINGPTGGATGSSQELAIDNLSFSATPTPHTSPIIASFSPNITYPTNGSTVTIAPSATVTSPATNFNTGNLTVSITSGGVNTQDVLGIANIGTGANQIGVSGSNVTFGGTIIGTVAGGTYPAALVITLNTIATPAATQALLQNVTYKNVGSPATLAVRTVQAVVDDGSGVGGSSSSPVSLTIGVVSGPLAVNDAYTAASNTPLTVPAATGLFANDNGFGQPLQVIVNSTPSHGTVTVNGADGSFVYTPANGYTGTDTFTYTVSNAVQLWKTNLPPLGTFGGVTVTAGGYGSSLTAVPNSPNGDEYYGLTDRGPNVGGPGGIKIEPIPTFAPAIGKFKLLPNGTALLEASIALKLPDGTPYTGHVNSAASTGETIQDLNGNVIPPDASGYDSEGLVALADGTFWVSDEYGPFMTHFDATGKQIGRLSPYDGTLPKELAVRVPNKGMEGLTVTPDGSMLVGMMQNALQQPDLTGAAASDPTKTVMNRIITYQLTGPNAGAVHEYMYLMEGAFGVSELTAVTNTTFLVDERDGKYIPSSTKKLFTIDITGASDVGPTSALVGTSNFTYSATTAGGGFLVAGKSLEFLMAPTGTPLTKATATTALTTAGLTPVNKTVTPALDLIGLLTTLDSQGRFFSHDKVEGVAVLNGGHKLLISNDSDFGITDSTSTVPPYALTQKTSPNTGAIDDGEFLMVNLDQLPTAPAIATVTITISPVTFNAVSSGDASATDVILWTRITQASAATVTAQVTTDFNFNANGAAGTFKTFTGTIDPTQDNTVKVNATGLKSGSRYYYRFVGPNGELSNVGTFKTAYDPAVKAPVHFAFSGDADGRWRSFPSISDIGSQQLDFFFFCGDTMYENASSPAFGIVPASPVVTDPATNVSAALAGLRTKYRENIAAVTTNGNASLKNFFAAQANYTLLDNHELCSNLGKGAYQCGGANTGAAAANYDNTKTANDINLAGPFANKTAEFAACIQAFRNYEPIRENILSTPSDPRSDQTYQLYRVQQWGKNMVFINTDDRSYADQRASAGGSPRADNIQRTRLGATQLAWLQQQLLAAQTAGTTWKIVGVSDPIDNIGALDGSNLPGEGSTNLTIADGPKSWMGGYRYERNLLLKFIADNKIQNVVFLATDDHTNRVNELLYAPDMTQIANLSSYVIVPGNVFSIVAGPIGASGPELFTDHTYSTLLGLGNGLAASQKGVGINPIGLDPAYIGLHDVSRENDPTADNVRGPIDFFSPDTENYEVLDISPDGKTLMVTTLGINSYNPNLFLEPSATGPVRQILSFSVDAYVNPITLTTASASGSVGFAIPLSISATLAAAKIQPTLQILASSLPAGATLSAGTLANGVYTLTPAQLTGLTITVPTAGSYSLAITANTLDTNKYVTSAATVTLALTVGAVQLPTALIGSVSGNITAGSAISFDGTASNPNIMSYAWDFGDGNKGTGATPSHTYTAAGSYTVTLTVTNSMGTSAPVTTVLNVAGISFKGKYNKSGVAQSNCTLMLPATIPVGTTAKLTIGTYSITFTKPMDGKTVRQNGGSLHVNGQTLTFVLKTNASGFFGTPLPASGTKVIKFTYNGVTFMQSVNFVTNNHVTTFE